MRIVVTGGCGFIGSHVVAKLAGAGHDVLVVEQRLHGVSSHAEYRHTEIGDLPGLLAAFDGADAVFHLAAVADVDRAAKDPLGTIDTNVSGTGVVLEAARQAGVGRVILASTVWVYAAAPGEGEIPEDAPLDPTRVSHVYTATKLAAEMLVHSYHELYGLDFTILRYGIPYGPGMRDELVIARFLNQALSGQPITIAGDGSQYRKYVYVGDLAEAHVLALDERAANQVIALDGSEQVSIRRIAEDVRTLVGDVTVTFTEKRAGDFAGREIATWKAESLLGWRPLTTFSDGLGRCLEWYRSRASAP